MAQKGKVQLTFVIIASSGQVVEVWKEFPTLVEWLGKCKIIGVPAAPIINSLW